MMYNKEFTSPQRRVLSENAITEDPDIFKNPQKIINEGYTDGEIVMTALRNFSGYTEMSDEITHGKVLDAIHNKYWGQVELHVVLRALHHLLNTQCMTERGRKYVPQVKHVINNLKTIAVSALGKELDLQ